MKSIKVGLLPRIIIAILLGIAFGNIFPVWLTAVFVTVNGIFSQFLGFIVALIIIALVVPAIVDIGNGAGKLLLVTVIAAYAATVLAGYISYFTGVLTFPSMIAPGNDLEKISQAENIAPFFTVEIPPVINVMSALVLAFILGLGIAKIQNDVMRKFFAGFKDIMVMVIERVILPLLPVYIFGIFLNITKSGQVMGVLSVFFKIIIVIFILHVFWLLFQYCVAGIIVKRNPIKLLYTMLPAYFTALGTQSSAATIPVTLRQTIENRVSPGVAGFVIPLCATIHLSGSMLKIVACALALMIMQGEAYDSLLFSHFIFILGITMVAAPGVPGGAIMAALGVLTSVLGFGENELALMIALYIAMDSFGTACNVTGDGAIALVIDKYFAKEVV